MNIHIVAGGPIDNMPNLTDWDDNKTIWVGVDRGTMFLQQTGITPTHAFGDFDSVSSDELDCINKNTAHLYVYPSEKDEIDTELALSWALSQKPSLIRIFGGTGGRLDHFFGNVQLLLKGINHDCKMEIVDKQNTLYVVKPGSYELEVCENLPYISFIPITPVVQRLSLIGFKYELKNRNISWGETLCISNELIFNPGTFSFVSGILLVIRSCDKTANVFSDTNKRKSYEETSEEGMK